MIYNFGFYRGILPILISNQSVFNKIQIFVKNQFIPIHYGGFWDVLDSFLTDFMGEVYLFTRYSFDEKIDDYPPNYEVYIVKNISLDEAVRSNFWQPHNYEEKIFIGEIPTKDVIFDSTNKQFVNTVVFEKFGS